MAPGGEKRKFVFFSLQLAVARGRKIDPKKVSEFYAKLPWESSLHDTPVQRYRGKLIVGAKGVCVLPQYILVLNETSSIILGQYLLPQLSNGISARQEDVGYGRETHGRIEESLGFPTVTMRTSWQNNCGSKEGLSAPTIIVDCSGGLRAFGTGDAGIERARADEDFVP